MREGLRSIVSAYSHLEVVGEAEDGEEAVTLAERLDPDVILMNTTYRKWCQRRAADALCQAIEEAMGYTA